MSESSDHLSQEIAVMTDVFSDLGERLLQAAQQLHSPGAPPPDHLLEELTGCRRDLENLRDRSVELAETLQVTCPPAETLDNLQGIAALLDDVAEAEIRQAKSEEVRRRALTTLNRILTLSHSGIARFAPLEQCKTQGRELAGKIAEASWLELPEDAEQIADGDHPFAALLTLIEDRHELSDDHWSNLHDSVGATFGKALAAAAARSKLVLNADAPPEFGNGQHDGSVTAGSASH